MNRNQETKGSIFVALAGICWGFTGLLQELAPTGTAPLSVASVRIIMAAVCFLLYISFSRRHTPRHKPWDMLGLILGSVGLAGFQVCFFPALKLTGVGLGTMLAIGTSPFFAGLVGWALFYEVPKKAWFFAALLSFIGCFLLIYRGEDEINVNYWGCGLALCAAFFYSLQGAGIKRNNEIAPIEIMSAISCISAMLLLPVFVLTGPAWVVAPKGFLLALTLGGLLTALPSVLFARGVKYVPLGKSYVLALTEPVTACLVAAFVLNERMPLTAYLGIGIILFSILLLARNA